MNIKLDIPEKFFEGEERCGYYVSPLMKKVWAVQLDLLAEFARVCEKHNLRWWMDAGTLLGAVRHKGFIPWDDDVDVMMMRKDYETFCEISQRELQYPYKLIDNEPKTIRLSRLCNESTTALNTWDLERLKRGLPMKHNTGDIVLDVFPVDKIPDNEYAIKKLAHRLQFYHKFAQNLYMLDEYRPSRKLWKRPIKALFYSLMKYVRPNCRNFIVKRLIMKCVDIDKSCNQHDSAHVAKLCMSHDSKFMTRRVWPLSDFDGVTYFPFEMLTLPAPSGWEDILNRFYGDWRKFVIREHNGKPEAEAFFFDTERPYTYYTQEGHIPNEDKI